MIIKPKEHASLFKNKLVYSKDKVTKEMFEKTKKPNLSQLSSKFSAQAKSQRMVFTSQEKARNELGSKTKKGKLKKQEKVPKANRL